MLNDTFYQVHVSNQYAISYRHLTIDINAKNKDEQDSVDIQICRFGTS